MKFIFGTIFGAVIGSMVSMAMFLYLGQNKIQMQPTGRVQVQFLTKTAELQRYAVGNEAWVCGPLKSDQIRLQRAEGETVALVEFLVSTDRKSVAVIREKR